MLRWRSVCVLASGFLLACATYDEEPLPAEPNTPPEAGLRTPVIAPVGRPVAIDASASSDRNADPLTYVFEFNDGSDTLRSAEALVYHTFAAQGLYSVRVRVIDLVGGESIAAQDVAVRDEYPDPPDFCEKSTDCVVGNECERGVCYATGGTLE